MKSFLDVWQEGTSGPTPWQLDDDDYDDDDDI
jgi:hypothetical protein